LVPRSQCPACAVQSARDNIPVLSWVLLAASAPLQGPDIGAYPIVEILLLHSAACGLAFGFAGRLPWCNYLTLIALTFIDADTTLLPDDSMPLLWLGLRRTSPA
jgi:leader peptidase (prepilin peptidase)/N-methyltransferase